MALPATPIYRRIFERVRNLKAALTAPNIRDGEVLFETLQNYLETWPRELSRAQDEMPEPAKEIFERHMDEATNFVSLVEEEEAEPDDRAWRNDALNTVLPKVDEALALDPFAAPAPPEPEGPDDTEMTGGKKRRKTRKGKSKRSRRARYSRRR